MPLWTYAGPDERIYPDHPAPGGRGVIGVPGGDPVELDEAPADGRWERVPEKQPAKTPDKKVSRAAGASEERAE